MHSFQDKSFKICLKYGLVLSGMECKFSRIEWTFWITLCIIEHGLRASESTCLKHSSINWHRRDHCGDHLINKASLYFWQISRISLTKYHSSIPDHENCACQDIAVSDPARRGNLIKDAASIVPHPNSFYINQFEDNTWFRTSVRSYSDQLLGTY